MFPLIEITTVPIEIKMSVKNASLEYTRGTAEMEISRGEGGDLSIRSRPIRLQLDSYESRGSSSIVPATAGSISQAARQGRQAAYAATATYAQQGGQLLVSARVGGGTAGQSVQEAQAQEMNAVNANTAVQQFVLPSGSDVDWQDGSMEIRYEMDKMNVDWKFESGEFKFTPGDIEISIEQQPDVIIKYVGGPLYVPPSADPNYTPVDVRA